MQMQIYNLAYYFFCRIVIKYI